jgi:hypothetical protein
MIKDSPMKIGLLKDADIDLKQKFCNEIFEGKMEINDTGSIP